MQDDPRGDAQDSIQYRLSIDDLIAAGFREGDRPTRDDGFDRHFWYSASDDRGRLWTVQVCFYQFSRYSSESRGEVEDGFSIVLHLRRTVSSADGDDEHFRLEKSVRHMDPARIIEWCAAAHRSLNCDYMSLYED